MLLNPLYFKLLVRNEIQPGELKEGEYWNTIDILLFQRFFGPVCILCSISFQSSYSKLYAIYKSVAPQIMNNSYHLFT